MVLKTLVYWKQKKLASISSVIWNIYNRDSYLIPTPTVSKKMKHNNSTYITIPGKS